MQITEKSEHRIRHGLKTKTQVGSSWVKTKEGWVGFDGYWIGLS